MQVCKANCCVDFFQIFNLYIVLEISVINHRQFDLIECEGVRINGVDMRKGAKRLHLQPDPTLQTYEFVFYDEAAENASSRKTSLAVALEIILQNCEGVVRELKICEVKNETSERSLEKKVKNILDKKPLVTAEYLQWENHDTDVKYDIILLEESSLDHVDHAHTVVDCLSRIGFIIYQGPYQQIEEFNLDIIFEFSDSNKSSYLLRKFYAFPEEYSVINVRNTDFTWIEDLKTRIKNESNEPELIYLVNQHETTSGIIGLCNSLRKEPSSKEFRFVFIDDTSGEFSVDDEFIWKQLKKNLVFNILHKKRWGTYVYIPLEAKNCEVNDANVTLTILGDLSTLTWIQSSSIHG